MKNACPKMNLRTLRTLCTIHVKGPAGTECATEGLRGTGPRACSEIPMSESVAFTPSFPALGRNRLIVALLAIGTTNALVRPAIEAIDEWGVVGALAGGLGSGWPV